MTNRWPSGLREQLVQKREELTARLARIEANVRRSLDSDSGERATELEDSEVVDALGNETRDELRMIAAALARMDAGEYGICTACGTDIPESRLVAWPYATTCIDCAELDEEMRSRG